MPNMIKLTMPCDPDTSHDVDLDTLTPKARAVAEALQARTLARISIRSNRTAREMHDPKYHALLAGPALDQPMMGVYDRWMKCSGPDCRYSIHQILEWEARKMPGWYPVAEDGSDLPSSQAARDDDGILPDQCLQILDHMIDKDFWMRYATKGLHGLPAPVRHNGYYSLWSEREVRRLADRLKEMRTLGLQRQAAKKNLDDITARLRQCVESEANSKLAETVLASVAVVDRMTVRKWGGKQ